MNTESRMAREFEYTDADIAFLRALITEHTGIVVSDNKRDMIYSRLARRLRSLGMTRFADYCRYLRTHEQEELTNLINAVTTNLTAFFREPHHFEHLGHVVVPQLLHENASTRRIRVWSAGCSTGEEPYSIAMVLEEQIPPWLDWDVKILATDLDTNVLETARKGVYSLDRIQGLSEARLKRFFHRGKGSNQGLVRLDDELRAMITFKQLNLLKDWPMKGPFDVIFCRNVLIYFDKPTQARLAERFADILAPRGYLYIGHSETLKGMTDRFEVAGNTIYRRKD
jgi:chemotaxis protein methyltransferase CheR